MTVVKSGHKSLSDYHRETLSLDVKLYHKEELDRLCKLLQTDSGFQIIILQFNDPLYRDVVIEKTKAIEKKSYVLSVDVNTFPTFQFFEEKIKELSREYDVIHLINLETWLFPPDSKSMIVGFNYHRESIAECKSTLLLWLTEPDIKAFAIDAPDMWAWRAAVLRFDVEKLVPVGELSIEPISFIERLSLSDRVKRINEIKDYLDKQQNDLSKNLRASLLHELGRLYYHIGKNDEAIRYFNVSLNIWREIVDQKWEATTLNNIGSVYYSWGKYDEAIKYYNESLGLQRNIGDRRGESTTLHNVASIYQSWGKYDEAIKCYNESLIICREIGDRQGEAGTLTNIGVIFKSFGKYDEAIEYCNKSIAIFREIGDRQGEATSLNNIGVIFKSWGKYDEAIKYYNESLNICREIGDRQGEAQTLSNIAVIYMFWAKHDEAVKYYNESLSIQKNISDMRGEAITLWNLGRLLQNKDPKMALDYFEQSLVLQEKLDHPDLNKHRAFVESFKAKLK